MQRSRSRRIKLAILIVVGAGLIWFMTELDRLRPGSLEWQRLQDLEQLVQEQEELDSTPVVEAPPAPREPVKVSCEISGLVTSEDIPEPLAGARVRLLWNDGRGALESRETTTDEAGAYSFEVPLELDAAGPDGQVDVALEISAPGRATFLRELAPNVLAERCRAPYDAWLERGRSLIGRVLSAEGDPVGDAEIHLYRGFTDRRGERSWIEVDAVRSVLDGRFAMVVRRPGDYSLRARADGLGAALDDLGTLNASSDLAAGDLRLSGGNALVGRVVDPAGGAIGGVLVRALHVSLAEEPQWDAAMVQRARLAESSLGQLYGQAQVGSSGEFEIAGLAPGDFWISCVPGGNVGELDPGPYASGRQDLVLVVPVYRVRVAVHARPGGARPRGRAYCIELVRDGERWQPWGELQTAHLFEGPQAAFRIEPRRTYAVGVMSSSLAALEKIVHVREGIHRTDVELHPGRARAFGTLVATIADLETNGKAKARFEILSPESRVVLRSDNVALGREGHSLELAPGSYILRAKVVTWPLTEDYSLPVEVPIEVLSRETSHVEVGRATGGRVRLSSYPAGTIVDEELDQLVEGVRLRGTRPSGPVRARHGARVFVGRPGNARPLISDLVFQDGYTPVPPRTLFPGEAVLLGDVLPSGRHLIGLEFPGFEPLRQSVNVIPGRTVEVRIALVPLR